MIDVRGELDSIVGRLGFLANDGNFEIFVKLFVDEGFTELGADHPVANDDEAAPFWGSGASRCPWLANDALEGS